MSFNWDLEDIQFDEDYMQMTLVDCTRDTALPCRSTPARAVIFCNAGIFAQVTPYLAMPLTFIRGIADKSISSPELNEAVHFFYPTRVM